MDVTTFHCPHCQAVLRMRGKQLADSSFQCPDCNQLLQCSQTAEGATSISVISTPTTDKAVPHIAVKAGLWLNSMRRWSTSLSSSPVLISWIIAGIGAILILVVLMMDHSSSDKITTQNQAVTVIETPNSIPKQTENSESPDIQPVQPATPVVPEPEEIIPAKPEIPPLQEVVQELIAVKPDQSPPLEAKKPQPASPLLSPETDVTIALEIPIIEFRQPKAVPLNQLIRQFEEMLDTQFQVAENVKSDPRLMKTPISFSLKNTTLSILLKQILSKAALTYTVKSNKIYIEKMESL
ncbi:MAG: hypothetical protein QM501_02860 [Gimesia sp.]